MFFWRKSTYYNSIDNCPIMAFQTAMSKNDFKKLHIKGKYNEKKAFDSYVKIFNEYIAEFGAPESFQYYIKKMEEATKYYVKMAKTGRKVFMTHAKIAEKEAETYIQNMEIENFNVTLAKVSKFMGFSKIDKCTVREFYGYLELIKNG